MGKIMYIVSFVMFAADLGTDIYVAVKHYENGDQGWFAWTLVFTVIPLVISVMAPCYAQKLYEVRDFGDTLVIGRYMEAMYESAPQWCLQVYIMLLKWEFPWYTILSTVFSLLGLTWSTICLKRKILEDEYDNWLFLAVSFLHELSGFISRFVVIAVFAYAFTPLFLAIAFAAHFVALAVTLNYIERRYFGSIEDFNYILKNALCCGILLFIVFAYAFIPFLLYPCKALFTALFKDNENRMQTHYKWTYVVIVVVNIIMLIMIAASDPIREDTHMDAVRPIATECVLGAMAANLGLLMFKLMFKCCMGFCSSDDPEPATSQPAVISGVASPTI